MSDFIKILKGLNVFIAIQNLVTLISTESNDTLLDYVRYYHRLFRKHAFSLDPFLKSK